MDNTQTQNNVDLMDLEEASQLSGLTVKTIRRYAKSGKLSMVKKEFEKGQKIFVHRPELEQLIGLQRLPKEQAYPLDTQNPSFPSLPNDVQPGKNQNLKPFESQIEELKKDKERLWQEKEEAVKQWRDQFQYNLNLLNERKLLTEGEQKVKNQLFQEKVAHEQEKRGLIEQYEKDKDTLQQQLEQQKKQTEAAYQAKLRTRNLTIGLMALFILLPLVMGISLILLHRGGMIQIPILSKISAVSEKISSEALDSVKKKAPKSENKINSQSQPTGQGSENPLTTADTTSATLANPPTP
jgi:hypothetical protein